MASTVTAASSNPASQAAWPTSCAGSWRGAGG